MAEYQLPEMLRTPLEELVLQIKVLRLGMAAPFLQKALEPPSPQAIDSAIQLLKDLNALHADEELTPLGHHLANLPVHPRIGRMILFGAIFSCLDPVLTIASALGFKEPFYIPLHKQEEADRIKKEFSANHESDHIAILNAYKGWERSRFLGNERQYSWNHFLSTRTLEMLSNMKRQFVELLYNIGFVSSTDPKDPLVNANSNEIMLIKAVLCAGLYPNVAKIVPGKRTAKLYTNQDGKVAFHPKSVNYEQPQFKSQFLIYFTKMRSSSIFIHDSTVVSPFPLLFFGGSIDNGKDGDQEVITVDKWIVFQAPGHIASLVKDLRHQLDNVLKEKIANPNMLLYQVGSDEPSSRLIQTIINLITTEDYSSQHQRLAQGKHLYTRRN
jgi:ATP-dependent RNA helicase DHX36